MRGEDRFESVPYIYIYIYIYTALPPTPTVTPNFLCAPNKISSRNKLFLGKKKTLLAIPPHSNLRLRLVHFRQAPLISGREF